MTQTEKMDRAAILHIPLSQYAFAASEYGITIRLRAKKGDLTRCVLYTADRVCRKTPVCFTEAAMRICAMDECFEYYEANLQLTYNRICYYFKLDTGNERTNYYAAGFTKELPDRIVDGNVADGRREYYQ